MRGYDEASYGDGMAEVYDDWYPRHADTDTAVAVLGRLAAGGRVLELGAGTGRLAIPLAATGLEVHALDASAAMLDRLRAKAGAERVTTHLGDMAADLPPGPFSLVFVAVNTLFNVTDAAAQQEVFAAVASRLTPGGRFVVEAFVPDAGREIGRELGRELGRDLARDLGLDGDHVEIRDLATDRVVLSVSRSHSAAQRAEGQFIELSAAHGIRLHPWAIRWATVAELDSMAAGSGLRVDQRWASWSGEPFGPDSENHVTIFRAAG